jgi:CelD/BcsL family acetyltransferase involved in cellulose biosynthesis
LADKDQMIDSHPLQPAARSITALHEADSAHLTRSGQARGMFLSGASPAEILHGGQRREQTRWKAAIEDDQAVFWARWSHLGHNNPLPTPFQSAQWQRDWYATLGAQPGVEPILVRVFDQSTGQDKLLLPLIRLRQSGLRVLAPADLDVTDVNSPLLQTGLNLTRSSALSLWAALRRELSQHGDVLRINKMPAAFNGLANPLALALTCRPSPSIGYFFQVQDCWTEWHRSLKRQARRESDRHWRVFQSYPEPKAERITDIDRGLEVLSQLEAMQSARLSSRCTYLLDQPQYKDFYRYRLVNGLKDGSVVLTALSSAGQIVAAAYGARKDQTLTLLRVAFAGDQWKACAPGRLIMERTARMLWEDGCRTFDLSIGSYAHKSTFGCSDYGLLELCTPLTWRGIPAALAWHAKHVIKPYKPA